MYVSAIKNCQFLFTGSIHEKMKRIYYIHNWDCRKAKIQLKKHYIDDMIYNVKLGYTDIERMRKKMIRMIYSMGIGYLVGSLSLWYYRHAF